MLSIQCPHCKDWIWIEQINCGIFRHAVFKHNLQQIPPHSSEQDCLNFIQQDMIYGCGKPFQIVKPPNGPNGTNGSNELNTDTNGSFESVVQECDYI